MAVSECPECTFHIPLPHGISAGDAMECPDCGAKLRLKSAYPPIFEKAGED